MGILQDKFDYVLRDQLSKLNLIKGVLQRALVRRGVQFTEEQLAAVATKVAEASDEAENASVSFDFGPTDEHVQLADDDLRTALTELESDIASGIEKAIPKAIEEFWPGVLSSLYADLPKALGHRRRQQRRFEKRLYARWKEGIDRLEMMLMIAQEAGDLFLADVRKAHKEGDEAESTEDLFLHDALIRIHVRSCRIASEVLHLLKGGFSDGANARWRSLHENAVIAMFIAQHGGDTAKRYLRHAVVECFKASHSYQEHCDALGQSPLSVTEVDALRVQYEGALLDFGNDFRHGYGWAARVMGKSSPTFADIESSLDMSRWRPYFKMACHSVHAGPRGLYFSLANVSRAHPALIAGSSDAGLCDPGHCCAISLMMVSAATFTTKSNIDGLVILKVMLQLCDDIGDALIKAHDLLRA
ncbi:MAG: hypothetical protein JWN40_3058 [Phycisphaerales bacterium]|nr:hypothetical protein [Phycisphaerales bacterium]